MYIDLSFCSYVYTQMYILRSTILYYGHVAWQFLYNIIARYIYNINKGSNLYIYMVDLILEHDIMVDLVLEHDMCGSCMCANLNEFPILKGRI